MKATDILDQARKHYDEAYDADEENMRLAEDDLWFASGKRQWDEAAKKEREDAGRPCPVVNRMPQFVRQVTGDIRQTNPAIEIKPGDSEATEDGAELVGGLVRQIEYESGATNIYEAAAENAAQCGRGFFRVEHDYEDPMSFYQCLKIKRIKNPLSVLSDPLAQEPTRSDGRYFFVYEDMAKESFEKDYPDAQVSDFEHSSAENQSWYAADTVRIADYYWREDRKAWISQMEDGSVVEGKIEGSIAQRETTLSKIMWAKVSGDDVLEGPKEWPGKYMPIIAVMGEELQIGRESIISSVIRHAKDPQRLYNYSRATHSEVVALQPKAPYLATADQVMGYENMWLKSNVSHQAVLIYNNVEGVSPPKREMPPQPSAGLMQEIAMAADDMKATTGIYDAALGERSNEQSGVAIRQRQLESDISTSIYVDNAAKAIEQCGRVLVDLIPKVYDTTRVLTILGREEQPKLVKVNEPVETEYGEEIRNNLKIGKYTARIVTGPSYSTQRQESAEAMFEFGTAYPEARPVIMDLVAKNMDWPGSDIIADRLRKLVPSEVLEQRDDMTPEEAQAVQMQQMQAQQQAQIQQAFQQAEMKKTLAEADEAEADAQKAKAEAAREMFELAMADGTLKQQMEDMISVVAAEMTIQR